MGPVQASTSAVTASTSAANIVACRMAVYTEVGADLQFTEVGRVVFIQFSTSPNPLL